MWYSFVDFMQTVTIYQKRKLDWAENSTYTDLKNFLAQRNRVLDGKQKESNNILYI